MKRVIFPHFPTSFAQKGESRRLARICTVGAIGRRMGPAKSQQRKRGPNSARGRKIPKYFAGLAYSKRLDFLRGLSAHGYEKEVSMMQTSSTGRGTRRHTYGGNPEDLAVVTKNSI